MKVSIYSTAFAAAAVAALSAAAATYAAPNAVVAPPLGRSLSGNAANAVVNLITPGTMYGDRVNQLDLRFAKAFKLAHSRTVFAVEIYNSLNASAVLTATGTCVFNVSQVE